MSIRRLEQSKKLREIGDKIGREGMSLRAIAAVLDFEGSYRGAMHLVGRLKAISQMAASDEYWAEKVDTGFRQELNLGDLRPDPDTTMTRFVSEMPRSMRPKRLDWKQVHAHGNMLVAETSFGDYAVWSFDDRDGHWREPGAFLGRAAGGDLQAAKDAAQHDFDLRVLALVE